MTKDGGCSRGPSVIVQPDPKSLAGLLRPIKHSDCPTTNNGVTKMRYQTSLLNSHGKKHTATVYESHAKVPEQINWGL